MNFNPDWKKIGWVFTFNTWLSLKLREKELLFFLYRLQLHLMNRVNKRILVMGYLRHQRAWSTSNAALVADGTCGKMKLKSTHWTGSEMSSQKYKTDLPSPPQLLKLANKGLGVLVSTSHSCLIFGLHFVLFPVVLKRKDNEKNKEENVSMI